jgi:hypothetical protein
LVFFRLGGCFLFEAVGLADQANGSVLDLDVGSSEVLADDAEGEEAEATRKVA